MDLNQPEGYGNDHAVILYSLSEPECAKHSPALVRFDLLDSPNIEGMIAFLEIFFPFRGEPTVRFSATGARIELSFSLMPTLLRDCTELLRLVPKINSWLDDWASSPDRRPSLEPAWATDHGIGPDAVRHISTAIVDNLANARKRSIYLLGAGGDSATLNIPARAQLAAPKSEYLSAGSYFEVFSKEVMARFLTQGGQFVLIRAGESPFAPFATCMVDSRRLVRTRIRTSQHVCIADPKARDEEST